MSLSEPIVAGASGTGTERFVGRAHEPAMLRASLEEAADGHGRLVLVAGEPGIGKTRLAEELAGYARARHDRAVGTLLRGRRRARLLAVGAGDPRLRRHVRGRDAARGARRRRGRLRERHGSADMAIAGGAHQARQLDLLEAGDMTTVDAEIDKTSALLERTHWFALRYFTLLQLHARSAAADHVAA